MKFQVKHNISILGIQDGALWYLDKVTGSSGAIIAPFRRIPLLKNLWRLRSGFSADGLLVCDKCFCLIKKLHSAKGVIYATCDACNHNYGKESHQNGFNFKISHEPVSISQPY